MRFVTSFTVGIYRSLPPGLTLAVGLTTILVLGLAVVSVRASDVFIAHTEQLTNAHDQLTELKILQTTLEDLEADSRGFVLTGQEEYRQQYAHALSLYPQTLAHLLDVLTPGQRAMMLALRPTIEQRVSRLQESLTIAAQNREKARRYIENGDGHELMDQIRVGLHGVENSIGDILAQRHTQYTELARETKILDAAGGTLAIAILIGSTWTIARQWHRRLLAEELVLKANSRLEADVMARTADLALANKELESFSYSVSHDLRAPLRVIEGMSEVLQRRLGDRLEGNLRSNFELIVDNTKKMRELIDDLLAFAKLGFQELLHETVDMHALITGCWDTLANERSGRSVTFQLTPLPPCRGDPKLLKQVVLNLLGNAIKYSRTRENPRIEIEASTAGGLVKYRIRDNGVGFDMAHAGKLFGVFQRLHADSEFEGTGIGLAICRRIVERHHGSIWADSHLDQGSVFSFTLPAAASSVEPNVFRSPENVESDRQ